jgi:Tol biopolymer transport system component
VRAGITSRVSVNSAGEQADGGSSVPSISADGRRVAFGSYATNLVPGDTADNSDVFVRDIRAGTTTAVSEVNAGEDVDSSPTISADGRQVAFTSWGPVLSTDTFDVFAARVR